MHYKKIVYRIFLALFISPATCFTGLTKQSHFEDIINEAYAQALPQIEDTAASSIFNQALAHVYIHNPHLMQEHHEVANGNIIHTQSFFARIILNRKKILYTLTHWGALCFFSYHLFYKYDAIYIQQNTAEDQSIFQRALTFLAPKLFISLPTHLSFFLQGTELIIQTYLMKQLLKMIIFCFA